MSRAVPRSHPGPGAPPAPPTSPRSHPGVLARRGMWRSPGQCSRWLESLGLERYAEAFRDHNITRNVLSSLTPEDLREMGVSAVGDRRRLQDAIIRDGQQGALAAGAPPALAAGTQRRRPLSAPPGADSGGVAVAVAAPPKTTTDLQNY